MNKRQKYNLKIIFKLIKLVLKYPDWRFGQLLWNCNILYWDDVKLHGVHDPHSDESEDICKRMT